MTTTSKRRASRSPTRDSEVTPTVRKGSSAKKGGSLKKKSKVAQNEEGSEVGFRATHLQDTQLAWLDVLFLSKLGSGITKVARKDLIVVNLYSVSPKTAKTIGGDLLCLNPFADFITSVWSFPVGMPIARLRSIAPSHRRHLLDVTDMDTKSIQQLPSSLVKLGSGLGLLFERFTQPPRLLSVSIEADLWQSEKKVKDALLGLTFVDAVEEVKWLRLKSRGNVTTRYTAKLALSDENLVEILESGGMDTGASDVISLKVDDVTKVDDVPGNLLMEARTFHMTARVGSDNSIIIIRRAPECSFCSSNEHLFEDCTTRITLLSAEVGSLRVAGWNTPEVSLTQGDSEAADKPNKGKPKRVMTEARRKKERERQRAKRAAKKGKGTDDSKK